ncbi:MAG: LysR family transcriptional regulator [Aliivibrio sp.]|uniref:LysR substrate-binding domain-containing protein n=1 Tax=Aliivibrio sp. TaxID=1872443 RepID=UPI001A4E97A6|nr:LysR family transcriptional regulator [Aliivibrio sp.]
MLKGSELPSIKALRTFIAVANNLSFSKAAEELCVTQGAVSKQISQLEQQLGQPLFERLINGIQLTTTGQSYLPKISEALESVQNATASLRQLDHVEEVLSLNVTPSFASLWLIKRLESFTKKYPNIRVSIKTHTGTVRAAPGENDIIISCLPLAKHYENAKLLCQETLKLVGSPSLLSRKPIRKIDDFKHHHFLSQVTRPHLWEQFKSDQQLSNPMEYYGVGFEHFYMSLEAVNNQYGLALLPDFMVNPLIEQQQLVNPMNSHLVSNYGYYVIIPSYKLNSRKVYEFNQWLIEQFADTSA